MEQIKTFVAVYELGSFQKASERLFLPQPTVSNRIQQLESSLGKKLIVRRKGKNSLTIEGKAFVPYALKILEALEQGQSAIDEISKGGKGRLVIGSTNTLSTYIIPEILRKFIVRFPDIDVYIDSYSTEEIINRVKMRKFQLGFTRYAMNDNSLTFRLIENEHIYLMVSKEHAWAKKKTVSLEEIVKEPLILYQKGTQYRETVDFTFNQFNIPYHVKYEMNNVELIKDLVKSNFGVTLFAPSYMTKELDKGEVVKIPIKRNPFPMRQIFLVYQEEELNSIDKLFIEHVISNVNIS